MQNKSFSSKIERIFFKTANFFIKVDNQELVDSTLKDPIKIKVIISDIDKEIEFIKLRYDKLNLEAEELFKYIDTAQKLLDDHKLAELEGVLKKRIIDRQNVLWDKIRDGVREENKLIKKEKELLDRKNRLNEKLKELTYSINNP